MAIIKNAFLDQCHKSNEIFSKHIDLAHILKKHGFTSPVNFLVRGELICGYARSRAGGKW